MHWKRTYLLAFLLILYAPKATALAIEDVTTHPPPEGEEMTTPESPEDTEARLTLESPETVKAPEIPVEEITATGAELQKLQEERRLRIQEFRRQYLWERSQSAAYRTDREDIRARRAANRMDCRAAMQQATWMTELEVALRCYRGGLTLDLELVRKTRPFMENALAGISDGQRRETIRRLDILTEALLVVIDGIDAGVFRNVDQVRETKQSLHKQYRLPVWPVLIHLRAARMLGWIAHIEDRIQNLRETTERPEETWDHLAQGEQCLRDATTPLQNILTLEDRAEAATLIHQSYEHLRSCLTILREGGQWIPIPEEEEPPTTPPEEVEEEEPPERDPFVEFPEICQTSRFARCIRRYPRFQSDIE